MTDFLIIAAMILGIPGISLVVDALLTALWQSSHKQIVIAGTFVVVAIGAYAASFVVDMVMLAWAGEIPWVNIVWPCWTWSLIATCALAVGAGRPTPKLTRILPFVIFGVFAMSAAIVHPRHIVTALLLILGGIIYAWATGGVRNVSQTRARKISRQSLPSAFAIGDYRIDTQLSVSQELVELTEYEYKFFTPMFKNEKIYKAPPTVFLGRPWNIMLGTVNGRIYKVAAFVELDNIAEANHLTDEVMRYCISRLGKPMEEHSGHIIRDARDGNIIAVLPQVFEQPKHILWDTRDGNVILQTGTVMGTAGINLFVTSRAAGSLERVV